MSAGRAQGLHALRLSLRVQARARFPHVYLGVALVLGGGLRWIPEPWQAELLPVLLLGEPGTLGLFLVAAQRFYEHNEGSDLALRVTPLHPGLRTAAPVLATALVGTAAGVLIQSLVLGPGPRLLLLVPPLFATVLLSGWFGARLADRFSEFTRFLLGCFPGVLLVMLPVASVIDWLPLWALAWLPSTWSLVAFQQATAPTPDLAVWSACCAGLFAMCAVFVQVLSRAPTGVEPGARPA